jgi:hypothetical protein
VETNQQDCVAVEAVTRGLVSLSHGPNIHSRPIEHSL